MTATTPRYIWIRDENEVTLIDDITNVWRREDFDETRDKFYQIGSEVKVKVSVEHVSNVRGGTYTTASRHD